MHTKYMQTWRTQQDEQARDNYRALLKQCAVFTLGVILFITLLAITGTSDAEVFRLMH